MLLTGWKEQVDKKDKSSCDEKRKREVKYKMVGKNMYTVPKYHTNTKLRVRKGQ